MGQMSLRSGKTLQSLPQRPKVLKFPGPPLLPCPNTLDNPPILKFLGMPLVPYTQPPPMSQPQTSTPRKQIPVTQSTQTAQTKLAAQPREHREGPHEALAVYTITESQPFQVPQSECLQPNTSAQLKVDPFIGKQDEDARATFHSKAWLEEEM
ncbi:uncharacterized protein LOC105421114 [Amborella trichopoda]|uniref:uncharacterized protein LOC105421114 n=1 Tax=Amborella trichopoda TaxID=13333 RepID=UPI0005D2FB7A|nr:uncharacterized protein LOC105421114 [Amborella trichopoda]|eukprot:XP_011625618.1 uncharacterized protein LOC105421114 [Amborella trichopoda]